MAPAIADLQAPDNPIFTRRAPGAGFSFPVKSVIVLPMEEIRRHYRMDRRQIAFFRFLLEAYGNLAVLRTLDPREGRVVLYLSRSRETELDEMIRALAGDVRLEPAAPADPCPKDDPLAL